MKKKKKYQKPQTVIEDSQKVSAPSENKKAPGKLKKQLSIIIAILAFVIYSPGIGFNYTLDDPTVTTDNRVITQGLKGIPTILTTDYWYGYGTFRVPQYRPISLVTYAIEWQFFPGNPHIGHLINILLFSLTCLLLFLFLSKLFEKQGLLIPFVCTLLYAVHPIHTEVVNSIKSRDEIFCFLFFIIAGIFTLRSAEKKSTQNLILASVFYFLGLLSKETAISFLILLPLILFVFTKTSFKKIFFFTSLLIIATITYFLIRSVILKSVPNSLEGESILNNTLYATSDFVKREATAFAILFRYLFLLIFPHPLAYDYSYSQIRIQGFSDAGALAGFIVYLFLALFSIYSIRKKNILGFAILFFLLTLAPVSNILLLIGSTMAERFLYMPSLGFCLAVTIILARVSKTEVVQNKMRTIRQVISTNRSLFLIVFALMALYIAKTVTRSSNWKNNATLFTHDVKTVNNSAPAQNNAGTVYLFTYYPEEKDKSQKSIWLENAIEAFKKAVEISPGYMDPHRNLIIAYSNKGDYQNALAHAEIVRRNSSGKRIDDFKQLAFLYFKTNQYERSLNELDSAIRYFPDSARVYNDKGFVLAGKGSYAEAIPLYQKAISLNPQYAEAYSNMGCAYCSMKQYSTGLQYLYKSITLNPADMESYDFIGQAYKDLGQTDSANLYFGKANRLRKL